MTKKEAFTKIINYLFEEEHLNLDEFFVEEWSLACDYWDDFKDGKIRNSGPVTENGRKLLKWMQENEERMSNIFTSRDAAEPLFTSGRAISGIMRKLAADEYVEKVGQNPVQYALTEKGRSFLFDN